MAKSKNTKTQGSNFANLTTNQYVKQRARNLPFVTAFINPDYEETGLALVFLVKQQGGGKYLTCGYLVFMYCLGIKDAFLHIGVTDYLEKAVEYYKRVKLDFKEIDVTLAQNIVWGGYEYALDLGFKPTKRSNFDVLQYVLDHIVERQNCFFLLA
jgi:hypothetical protein